MSKFYVARNLKRLRTFYGYGQRDLAEQMHITRQAYSHYERGTRLPDLETAVRLAEFYKISLDCLLLAEDPARMIWEEVKKGNALLAPVGNLIPVDGAETKMVLEYKELDKQDREEVNCFVKFKKSYSGRKKEFF